MTYVTRSFVLATLPLILAITGCGYRVARITASSAPEVVKFPEPEIVDSRTTVLPPLVQGQNGAVVRFPSRRGTTGSPVPKRFYGM